MNRLTTALLELQEITLLISRSLRRSFRKPFYFRETLQQMDIVGIGSLPIVILCGFFIGAVLALNMSDSLKSFGAQNYTGRVVMFSLLRELAPVLTCIVLAGRVGSGFAAELGSMMVSEQIDAMRAMGTDPIKKLVVPRMLACLVMAPALTTICIIVGNLGGLVVANSYLGLAASVYVTAARAAIKYYDLIGSMSKAVVFGVMIAAIGCRCGLRTYGGTMGVGRSTTQSVVAAIVTILVTTFFLTRLIMALRGGN